MVMRWSSPKFHLDEKSYWNEKKRLNLLWKILQPRNRVERVRHIQSRSWLGATDLIENCSFILHNAFQKSRVITSLIVWLVGVFWVWNLTLILMKNSSPAVCYVYDTPSSTMKFASCHTAFFPWPQLHVVSVLHVPSARWLTFLAMSVWNLLWRDFFFLMYGLRSK